MDLNRVLIDGEAVFDKEIKALEMVKSCLNGDFAKIVQQIINCKGKVILSGMGKSGHIANKIAATLASLGTPSFCLHPAEALHGDLGMVTKDDLLLAISYSGESEEIKRILPNIKLIGAKIIAISGNQTSTLVKYSDYSFVFPKFDEACPMNLAPTSSTTAALVLGDAFAVCASRIYGFNESNYALFHPAGSLGKKLLIKVSDIMHSGERNAIVVSGSEIREAIVEMSTKALGIISILDSEKRLIGVFTDGDLRRLFTRSTDIYQLKIDDVMGKNPKFISSEMLAVDALKYMHENNISALPILKNNDLVGTIRVNDIIGEGIVL